MFWHLPSVHNMIVSVTGRHAFVHGLAFYEHVQHLFVDGLAF